MLLPTCQCYATDQNIHCTFYTRLHFAKLACSCDRVDGTNEAMELLRGGGNMDYVFLFPRLVGDKNRGGGGGGGG